MTSTILANPEYLKYLELFQQGAPEQQIDAAYRVWARKVRKLKNHEDDEPDTKLPGSYAKHRPG